MSDDEYKKLEVIGLRVKTKNKRRKNKKKKSNEYTDASLEIAGILTKHLPGKHDQSSHGNRIGAAYGYSHNHSYDITGIAARTVGEDGYRVVDEGDNKPNRLAARSALRGVRDSRGSREPLYSGHSARQGEREHQVGDSLVVPLMSTSGSRDQAHGYSTVKESDRGAKHSVMYEFEPGTKFRGYQKNEDRDEDYNHRWDEALVSGRFEVVGTSEEQDQFFSYEKQDYETYTRTVYQLRQTHVFDPDSGEWVEVGVEKTMTRRERLKLIPEEQRYEIAKRVWNEAQHPRVPRGNENAGQFTNSPAHSLMIGGRGGGERESVRYRVAPTRPAATGARKTAAKKTAATPAKRAAATPPVKRVAAKKATTSPAPAAKKTATKKAVPAKKATSTRGAPNVNRALYAGNTVASTSSIPRINRGGTHMMMQPNGRPLVAGSYATPGEAYYARNVGVGRISNNRLRDIFEDPSNMTIAERRMIASAGGAKNLDGEDMIEVQTSRGPRLMERYKVIGQLRSKMAPGSGNREETRQSAEAREKQAAKRRASGKPSAAGFAQMEKQITEDWSTDGGKTVVCVFCGKKMSPKEMSVETPKPKALGGNYRDRGGRWPSHASCNTKAGEQAQKDPIAYQEDMMKKFARLPLATRKRLPHVYAYFPQLGAYPGTEAEKAKYMARGPK